MGGWLWRSASQGQQPRLGRQQTSYVKAPSHRPAVTRQTAVVAYAHPGLRASSRPHAHLRSWSVSCMTGLSRRGPRGSGRRTPRCCQRPACCRPWTLCGVASCGCVLCMMRCRYHRGEGIPSVCEEAPKVSALPSAVTRHLRSCCEFVITGRGNAGGGMSHRRMKT